MKEGAEFTDWPWYVAVVKWPDDESASAFMLSVALAGNGRSETMRAYTAEEVQRIVQKLH